MEKWRVAGFQLVLFVEIMSKKLGESWKDVCAKLKKTFLKRLEDVFSYKSGV